MTAAYDKVVAFVQTLKNELDWEDYLILSGRFEQCGYDKRKQKQKANVHNKELIKPPITMTQHGT